MQYLLQEHGIRNSEFGINQKYNEVKTTFLFQLCVTVVECKSLPAMDRNGSSDPYCRLTLLPEKKLKFSTKTRRNDLNPVFDETFIFNISFNELQRNTLQIVVTPSSQSTNFSQRLGIRLRPFE